MKRASIGATKARPGAAVILATIAGAGAVGVLAMAYASWVERTRVRLDHFTVEVNGREAGDGSAPKSLPPRGLTILHLSDFHFRANGAVQDRKIERLRRLLETEHFDVVALTGDLIHDCGGLAPAMDVVCSLKPRLATYFCPGNHDYAEYTPFGVMDHTWRESSGGTFTLKNLKHFAGALAAFVKKVVRNELVRMPVAFNDVPAMIEQLEAACVVPLVNASAHLQTEDLDVWFAGVDDEMESKPDLAAALENVPPQATLVLLAHNPDIWLQCGVDRADLVLSGHTHGGQIHVPGVGAVHTQGTHLARSRPAGWFERGRSRMFVSRGIGESIPFRLGAGPQAAIITLVPKMSN